MTAQHGALGLAAFSKLDFKAPTSFYLVTLQFAVCVDIRLSCESFLIQPTRSKKGPGELRGNTLYGYPQMAYMPATSRYWLDLRHVATSNHKEVVCVPRRGRDCVLWAPSQFLPQGGRKFFNNSSFPCKTIASSRIHFSTASCDKCYDCRFYFIAPLLHSF